MIRQAHSADTHEVLRRAAPPVTGVLCAMHWQMLQENPRLPHRFYLVGEQGLMKVSGGRATLCGPAEDVEEIGAFLRFANITLMTALDFSPPGWRMMEINQLMLRPPFSPLPAAPQPLPPGFVPEPTAEEVMAVLESTDGPIRPTAARDFFYVDFCTRRNHGKSAVYGLRVDGRVVSTAGVWALTENAGYLACVETCSAHQHQGYASGLISRLCNNFDDKQLSLLCGENLTPFYARFGFTPAKQMGLISVSA